MSEQSNLHPGAENLHVPASEKTRGEKPSPWDRMAAMANCWAYIPPDWQPTLENLAALPEPLRNYIQTIAPPDTFGRVPDVAGYYTFTWAGQTAGKVVEVYSRNGALCVFVGWTPQGDTPVSDLAQQGRFSEVIVRSDQVIVPDRPGIYSALGVFGSQKLEQIDVYPDEAGVLCCFANEVGGWGGPHPEYGDHVPVEKTGMVFVERVGDLA